MATPTQPSRTPSSSAMWETGPPVAQQTALAEISAWNKVHRGLNLVFWGQLGLLILAVLAGVVNAVLIGEGLMAAAGEVVAVVASLLGLIALLAIIVGVLMAVAVPMRGRLKNTVVASAVCLLAAVFFGVLASLMVSATMASISQFLVVAHVVLLISFLAGLGRAWDRASLTRNANGLLIALVVLLLGSLAFGTAIAEQIPPEAIGTPAMLQQVSLTDVGIIGGILALLWLAFQVWYVVTLHMARRTVDVSRLVQFETGTPGPAMPQGTTQPRQTPRGGGMGRKPRQP